MVRAVLAISIAGAVLAPAASLAQELPDEESESPVAPRVQVRPTSTDGQIEARLERVLRATRWFSAPEVEVDQGVVFLRGTAKDADAKEWAGDFEARRWIGARRDAG